MKNYLFLITLLVSVFGYSQNDNIPFATKALLKKDAQWIGKFNLPDNGYSKSQAIIDNEKIIQELYKPVDGIKKMRIYNKRLKILTEGFADVLSNNPYLSPFVSMGKEYLYQKAEESVENKIKVEKNKFNDNLKAAFTSSVSKKLKDNPDLTYLEAVDNFSNQLESFATNLKPEDYKILAPIADKQSLEFIKQNRLYFEQKFKEQQNDIENIVAKSKDDLTTEFNAKMADFKTSINNLDKKLLSEIQKNASDLAKFNERVESKFQKLDNDVKEMRSDIKKNETQIKFNKNEIENNKQDIVLVKKLQAQNIKLSNENSFKIGVITDVLYDNVNTDGKIRILELNFKDDKNNPEYLKAKNTLENIQTIQKVQSYLSNAGEFVELAGNLGLSKQDMENANKAIQLGNVLVNGTMAFYGNPMAGIQAINGAFALFGGSDPAPDPQFEAIMAEFKKINQRLDEINEKLDVINDNILDLRKLNVDLFIENQKRFTKIDEKLITINSKLDRITQLIYSDNSLLKITNASQYIKTWRRVENAKDLDELRGLYSGSQELKDMVRIIYINTKSKSLADKKFIHFNNFEVKNDWEDKIYNPMFELIKEVYPNINLNNLENSIVNLFDYTTIPKLNNKYNEINIFKKDISLEMDILIYPQSILTLTQYTSLVEPYLYLYNDDKNYNFNIPQSLIVDTSLKNDNTKIKFENILLENRKSIAQTNVIAGGILLPYFKKHIFTSDFDIEYKNSVYKLLLSQNEYLKLNFSNYLINTELTLPNQIEKFYELQNETNFDKALKIVKEINIDFNFESSYLKLSLVGNQTIFRPVISLLPQNIEGFDLTKQEIMLPIPPFEYISEQKVLYPEYLQGLLENENFLANKIAKYDIIERTKNKPEYANYLKLN